MYTRFIVSGQTHIFDSPSIKFRQPPGFQRRNGPGSWFAATIGIAYEDEQDVFVGKLLREATYLYEELRDSTSRFYVPDPDHASKLEGLIQFLFRFARSEVVSVYSFDKKPSLDDLIAAERQPGGSADWAVEEIQKRGKSMIRTLGMVLADGDRTQDHLSAVRILLFCFPGKESRRTVQQFVNSGEDTEEKHGAAMLLSATTQSNVR